MRTEDAAKAGVRALILTTVDADQYVHDAHRAGSSTYTRQARSSPGDLERIGQLTPRETELLLFVARGMTNAGISAQATC